MDSHEMATALREAILRAEPRLGYTRLAKKIGESYNRLYNMANGRTEPDPVVIAKVRKELKLPDNWPEVSGKSKGSGKLVSLAGTPLYPVPVVGRVAAGEDVYNVDPDEREVYVPQKLYEIGGIGYVISGDSMMPDLEENTVALFREYRQPRRGFTYLVKSDEKGFQVKNLEWMNNEWTLVSINPAYPPEPLGNRELIGFLIGWYWAKGTREKIDSDPEGLLLTRH
jgi:SOS-response transcriptional repressor LexA